MNTIASFFALAAVLGMTASCFAESDWTLVWAEEFDQDGLPNPERWSHEKGFVRNRELQYYTVERAENCRIENGMLIIEGRREDYPNPNPKTNVSADHPAAQETARYTSASIHTRGKVSFHYGRIEVRAKLPQGQGMWPAIWTLGEDITTIGWPRCGEIDIMEFVGKAPDKVHATVHFAQDGKHRASGKHLTVERPFDDFHVYAVEWTDQRLDFYFDDRLYHSVDVSIADTPEGNPLRRPHYLLLNLAIGGSWGGEVDDSILPQQYLIDYVRYYKRADD